jgi:FG-GAP-like repeat/Tetratricopeptide repeat
MTRLIALYCLILLLLLGVAVAIDGQGLPEEMQKAQALIQANDHKGAIPILEDFTKKFPQRLGALNMLAGAYRQTGDLDKALAAYRTLEQARPFQAQAFYGIAAIHAARKERAQAFTYLEKLRRTGSYDLDSLRTDPLFASIRNDHRFKALMPKPSDFERPFVENVKVLYELRGKTKGEQFGWVARRVGDVDKDGAQDFATSSPTYGTSAGRVFTYSGKSGKLLWQVTGQPNESLGFGVERAGDTDADGVPDVVAGAPGSGYAYVLSGKDGHVLRKIGTGNAAESFGRTASTAGDLDGDGHADVLVGAPGMNGGAGKAFVYSGKTGEELAAWDGEKASDGFGNMVAGPIDARHPLLLIGASGAGPRGTGRVYLYRGLSDKPAATFDSDETGAAFGGMFLSVVGDVNADGVPDLYISDFPNQAKGPATGRIYVYSGADASLLTTITGETAGDGFGIGVADAGDVNRDGHADLVVGAWQYSGAAPSAGKVYLHSGANGALLKAITCRTAGDTFGFDTTNLGDVDGDGTVDLLLTSAWSGVNGFQSGRLFVVSSGVRAAAPLP